ncbi:hypothetical protein AX14_007284 [Amanita brunnescens Koide BX004]|nr:hypothetical protein AX14_007284 [Amanita brunnescens Koide BX004]
MLSLHALLFFILGACVFSHPVPSPLFRLTKRLNPSVAQELQKLLEKQSFAGQSTWIRTTPTELDKKCDDVITFDPAKLPRISTLLGEPGKLSEGKDVEGNLKQVLEKIKGSWILRPDSTNADHRTSEMTIDPDDQGKPIEIGRPNVKTEEWKKTEEHNYPLQGPLSEHVAGWWYRRPPMNGSNWMRKGK